MGVRHRVRIRGRGRNSHRVTDMRDQRKSTIFPRHIAQSPQTWLAVGIGAISGLVFGLLATSSRLSAVGTLLAGSTLIVVIVAALTAVLLHAKWTGISLDYYSVHSLLIVSVLLVLLTVTFTGSRIVLSMVSGPPTPGATTVTTVPRPTTTETTVSVTRTVPTSSPTTSLGARPLGQSDIASPSGVGVFGSLLIGGRAFNNALRIPSGPLPVTIEVNVGRNTREFRGTIGIPDNEFSAEAHRVTISRDGVVIYMTDVSLGKSETFVLEVTGALRMGITVSSLTGQSGFVAIGDPVLA